MRCFIEHDHRQSGVIEQHISADICGIKRSFTVSKQSNNQTPSLLLRSSTTSTPPTKSTQLQEIVLKCIENKDSSLKFLRIYQRLKEDKLVGEFVKKTETPFVPKLGRAFTRQEYSNLIKKQMGDDDKVNIESYLSYTDRLKQQDSPVSTPHTIQSTAPRKRRTRRGHTNKGTMSHQKQLPNEETVVPVAVRNIIWTLSYNEISVICLCRLIPKGAKFSEKSQTTKQFHVHIQYLKL